MKTFLIVLIILSVAIFTGTWIFDGLAWLFNALASGLEFLSKAFNLFGWNGGILCQVKRNEVYSSVSYILLQQ